ncbi:MAG: hypothetical protein QHH80_14610, partial [Anaerolineae bacterium]|nr:hypothetical protein [Anaerolineae bacterium]
MRKTIRALIFLVAILAVLVLFIGGGYLVWKQMSAGPKVDVGTLPTPDTGGVEKQLIGVYLQLRQADLETPADPTGKPVPFTVEPGETAADIAAKLQQVGLIKDADLFR